MSGRLFNIVKPGRRHNGCSAIYLLPSSLALRPASPHPLSTSSINQSKPFISKNFFNLQVHREETLPVIQTTTKFTKLQVKSSLFSDSSLLSLKPVFASTEEHRPSCSLTQSGLKGIGSPSYVKRAYSTVKELDKSGKEEEGISGKMAEGGRHVEEDGEIRYPAVDTYGPITIRGSDLEPGKKKKWCTCGLSKKAPWCDGAHKKTGFRSLKWEVPEKPQAIYQICNCKYTKSPPFCDGTHTNLPEVVLERQKNCPNKANHEECVKLCTGCGWKVDF